MRILYANSDFSPHVGGGAEIILKMLAAVIRERGHPGVLRRDTGQCIRSVEHLTRPSRMIDEHEQFARETVDKG